MGVVGTPWVSAALRRFAANPSSPVVMIAVTRPAKMMYSRNSWLNSSVMSQAHPWTSPLPARIAIPRVSRASGNGEMSIAPE
jgi:hypothetical protein